MDALYEQALELLETWTSVPPAQLRESVVGAVAAWTGRPVTLFDGAPPDRDPHVLASA